MAIHVLVICLVTGAHAGVSQGIVPSDFQLDLPQFDDDNFLIEETSPARAAFPVRQQWLIVGSGSCVDGAGKNTAHYVKSFSSPQTLWHGCSKTCAAEKNCLAYEMEYKQKVCTLYTPGGDLTKPEGWGDKKPGTGATKITSILRKRGVHISCKKKREAWWTPIGEGECDAAAKKISAKPSSGLHAHYWKKLIASWECRRQCYRDSSCTHYEWKYTNSSCEKCRGAGTSEKPSLCVVFTPEGSIAPSGWSTSLPDGKRPCFAKRQATYLSYFDGTSRCPWTANNIWKTFPVEESSCETAVEQVLPNGKTEAENKGLVKLDSGDWYDKPGYCSYKTVKSGTSSDNKAYFNRKFDRRNPSKKVRDAKGNRVKTYAYSIVCSDTKAEAPYLHLGSGACRDYHGKYTNHSYKAKVSKIECKKVCSRDKTCTHYNWFEKTTQCVIFTPTASVGPSGWTFTKGQDGAKDITQRADSGNDAGCATTAQGCTVCMEKKKANIAKSMPGKCVDAKGKHTDFYTLKVEMSPCRLQCIKDATCTHFEYNYKPKGCTVYTTKGGLATSRPKGATFTKGNGATAITKGDGQKRVYCWRKLKAAGYVAGSKGSDKCPPKTSHVKKGSCRYAVLNSLCSKDDRGNEICQLQGKTALETGDWSKGKPFGCSIGPENQPYYNTKKTGKNDGKFTPVCFADALAEASTSAKSGRRRVAKATTAAPTPPPATPAPTALPTQASTSTKTKATYVEGTVSGSDDGMKTYVTEDKAQSACDADAACVGYLYLKKFKQFILLKKGSKEWVKGTFPSAPPMGKYVTSVKVKTQASTSTKTKASTSTKTKATYVEGTVSGSDGGTKSYATEDKAQSACDADAACVGYYYITKFKQFILLKEGSKEWVKGTYPGAPFLGKYVTSVKVKTQAGSLFANTPSSTPFDDDEENTKISTSNDDKERTKVDALEDSSPTQTIMRKQRRGEVSLAVDDRGEVTVAPMEEEPKQ